MFLKYEKSFNDFNILFKVIRLSENNKLQILLMSQCILLIFIIGDVGGNYLR